MTTAREALVGLLQIQIEHVAKLRSHRDEGFQTTPGSSVSIDDLIARAEADVRATRALLEA